MKLPDFHMNGLTPFTEYEYVNLKAKLYDVNIPSFKHLAQTILKTHNQSDHLQRSQQVDIFLLCAIVAIIVSFIILFIYYQ